MLINVKTMAEDFADLCGLDAGQRELLHQLVRFARNEGKMEQTQVYIDRLTNQLNTKNYGENYTL